MPAFSARRLLQFRIRTLLVLMTVAGCGLGWLGKKVADARRQRAAIVEVLSAGGVVFYDYQLEELNGASVLRRDSPFKPAAESPIPAWLSRRFGDDFLIDVAAVELPAATRARPGKVKGLSNDALKSLQTFPRLRELDLTFQAEINDDGLRRLRRLTQLERLILDGTNISDDGLPSLVMLSNLRRLNLYGTRVSQKGVDELQIALPNCRIWWKRDLWWENR